MPGTSNTLKFVILTVSLLACIPIWLVCLWQFGAQSTSNGVTSLGILVAGSWTLYQFVLRSPLFESTLSIKYAVWTEEAVSNFVVFFDVVLENTGKQRITAPLELSQYEITQYEKSVAYPADLQIKRLRNDDPAPRFAAWWPVGKALEDIPGVLEHISLLSEYTREGGDIEFFMEPSETYHLGSVLVLPAGHYVAKIVFVGERKSAAEYWSRIVYFRVPVLQQEMASRTGESERTSSFISNAPTAP
jgi:hypothetical protein